MRPTPKCKRLAVIFAAATIAFAALTAVPAHAAAGPGTAAQSAEDGVDDSGDPVQLGEVDQPVGGIIPRPNSGATPAVSGDRGGAEQWLLLGLIVAFFAVATTSVVRAARKAQAERAALGDTRS